ncbi:MAG: fibronectin type III domain-containing protein [Defluviitaleaceae bacterium]|nr:fibronectin type III domain-containing protein [Defluviitaleaceae bacterium]
MPQNFTASPGDGQVTLSWTAPFDDGGEMITHFEVSSNNGASWEMASSNTGHIFTGLTNGIQITFRVRAVNIVGHGPDDSVQSTPVSIATVPSEPINFTATPGDTQVTLNWQPPLSNGGANITHFQVSRDNGASWVNASSNTSHTFTGLTNGIQITFRVRAVNSVGHGLDESVQSTPVSAVTVPSAPRNFTVIPGNAQATLSWLPPLSNGGANITHFQVSRDNGASWVNASSSTGHTFTGLTNGTPITFRVRAVNSAGPGADAIYTATPTAANAPTVPRDFRATPGDRQITLNWTVPQNNGGSAILRYEVSRDNLAWVNVGLNTSHIFTGLTNGTQSTFRVRAVNATGHGPEATVTATPIAAADVPSIPRDFRATPGDRQVTLSWSVPQNNGGATITRYEVSRDNGTTWINASSNTGHTFTGLTNGTAVTFRVRAVTNRGHGAEAAVTATPVSSANLPSVPRDFTATPGNGQVTLNWTAPQSNGGAAIIRYEVSRDNGATWVNASHNTGHTFTGLTNGTAVTFRVRAVTNRGHGVDAAVTATPTAAAVPTAPRDFRATPGNGQVTLNWIAPQNNGGAVITHFQVSRDNGATWVNASSNTGHTFTGLTNGILITFRVRAINIIGHGADAVVTSTPTAPFQPPVTPTLPGEFFPGRGGFTFAPDVPVSRGELAQAIFNLKSGSVLPLGSAASFTDTAASPFNQAIGFVSAMGFMQGDPEGTFRPAAQLTRGEAAAVLVRMYGLTGIGTSQFADMQGHWSINYVALAADRGIILGHPDNTFQPNSPLRRGEATALLVRADNRNPMTHLQSLRFQDVPESHWAFNYIMSASVPRQ